MICQHTNKTCKHSRECLLKKMCLKKRDEQIAKEKYSYGSQVDGVRMRQLGDLLEKELPGLGFALFTFQFGNVKGLGNYISNADRADMIAELEQTIQRLKNGTTFPTPENN